ncbi:GroES-like protein [Stipitochalara longipes BDJ]|nr:GroES-like protein [Stipitochalara longipes BDJ]
MSKVKEVVKDILSGGKDNQAAWLDGQGAKLRVDNAEMPTPGPDEVVVKNHAVAVNPADWKIQDFGGAWLKVWPFVLGTDIAGEVHEVGSNVTKFKKGDRVLAHVISLLSNKPQDGGFQLYAAAPTFSTAIIPSNISYVEATVLPLAVDTAAVGLYDSREKGFIGLSYPSLNPTSVGKTILVWGGSSSVGALAIQLAVASGAKVIAVASSHNHELVKGLGAIEAIDYNKSSVVEDVVKAIQSVGGDFQGIYDAISSQNSYEYVLPIAEKLGGANVITTLPPPEIVSAGIKIGHIMSPINPAVTGPVWEHYITPALKQGKLKCLPEPLVVGKRLGSIQKGLDTNKAGVSAKKVVIEL